MARIRIDLFRLRPVWYWSIALIIVGLVSTLAWWVAQRRPQATSLSPGVRDVLGWCFIVLALVALITWPLRRRRRR